MSPFTLFQTDVKASRPGRSTTLPAFITFGFCLALGLTGVYWRTETRAAAARESARKAGLAQSLALELQLSQAATGAEVLGALARQSGGAIPNFQKVAADLLAVHPGLASLELEPGGVVTEIVPRTSQDHAVGLNVLKDAGQAVGARQALVSRALTVSGPLPLGRGGLGIVARVPIFVRGRDGREAFWGFVAVSQRFPDALARSGVDQLLEQGYGYAFFMPGSDRQKAMLITARGRSSFPDAVQQPVRVRNLRLCLAVEPQGGWINKSKAAIETLGVLVVSGLVGLLVNLFEVRRAIEEALEETDRRLVHETAERKQAQADCRASKESLAVLQTELGRARSALQQAQVKAGELQAGLESAERTATEIAAAAQAKLEEIQVNASEGQSRLETGLRAAEQAVQAKDEELGQARVKVEDLQLANKELRDQLETARAVQQEGTASSQAELEQAQASVSSLQTQLEAARLSSEQALRAKEAELEQARAAIQQFRQTAPDQSSAECPLEPPTPEPPSAGAVPIPATVASAEPTAAARRGEDPALPRSQSQDPARSNGLLEAQALKPPATDAPSASAVAPRAAPRSTPEPVPQRRSGGTSRRKRDSRENQMDLFGNRGSSDDVQAVPATHGSMSYPFPAGPKMLRVEPASPGGNEAQPEASERGQPLQAIPAPVVSLVQLAEPAAPVAVAEAPVAAEGAVSNGSAVPAGITDTVEMVEGLASIEEVVHAGGDPKLYVRALRYFVEHQAGAPERIRDALVQGHRAAAEQVLAVLKGAAGEIGALAVQATAGKLARALEEASDPADLEFLWADLEKELKTLIADLKPLIKSQEERPGSTRPLPPAPPVNPAQLRKAISLMLPLLTDKDPGAKDCLKDNRSTFRSAFTPEGYADFEGSVKNSEFDEALEQLKKAAKKHGISG